jgi:hypothetical protein
MIEANPEVIQEVIQHEAEQFALRQFISNVPKKGMDYDDTLENLNIGKIKGIKIQQPFKNHDTSDVAEYIENTAGNIQLLLEKIFQGKTRTTKHSVYVVWGDTRIEKSEYDFNTLAEKNAFIQGIEAADGYLSGTVYNDKEDWEAAKLDT